ncbi:MAG: chemotaxis protein CheB [Bacteroidetes bacterium]|nr:chemotaxis protein CheB [Bacteroidota bacterium]
MAEDRIAAPYKMVMIGGSAGSLDVILKIIDVLPAGIAAPVVVLLHRKSSNDGILVELLSTRTRLHVKEIEEKEAIQPGWLYIVPGDYHLLLEKDFSFSLDDSEKVNYSRPSIDVSFESAADVYGPALIAVLLSGANIDGVEGLRKVKEQGGLTIVQEPGTAEVDYMPRQAIKNVEIDIVAGADQLGAILNELLHR